MLVEDGIVCPQAMRKTNRLMVIKKRLSIFISLN
jgi:hypothetical protein